MTLALLGLIAFQWYWVSNYFEANKKELDWEINRALSKTSERYLRESLENTGTYIWGDRSNDEALNLYNQYHQNSGIALDSTLGGMTNEIEAMSAEYMQKVNDMINDFLINISHPKIINFDRLLELLDEELKRIGINNEYNLAISNIDNKVIYFKDPETLQATILFGYKSPVILSSISNPYFTHLFIYHKGKLLLQKTWIILLSSILLVCIILTCFAYALHIILSQKKISDIKNDFVNNMTHELKTPISTVSLALEALVNFDVRDNEKKTMQYLGISRREIKRLSSMVEKVLNIDRYERGDVELKLQEVSLNELVESTIDTISMQVQRKNGEIHCDLEANPDMINLDKDHISSILFNLIDNSNKYFIDKPIISVKTKNYKEGLLLEIFDQGIGIQKDELKRIFDKFYRVPTGNVHNVKGYGLGLSYVQDIINMHGGSIKVQSELNKGSRFIIHLPYENKNQSTNS